MVKQFNLAKVQSPSKYIFTEETMEETMKLVEEMVTLDEGVWMQLPKVPVGLTREADKGEYLDEASLLNLIQLSLSCKIIELAIENINKPTSDILVRLNIARATILEMMVKYVMNPTLLIHSITQSLQNAIDCTLNSGHKIQACTRLAEWQWHTASSQDDLKKVRASLCNAIKLGNNTQTIKDKDEDYAQLLQMEFLHWTTQASSKLALFLSLNPSFATQNEVVNLLSNLGFQWKLHSSVFAYNLHSTYIGPPKNMYIRVIDDALSKNVFERFKKLMKRDGGYFRENLYNPYKSTGYISYLFPTLQPPRNFMEQVYLMLFNLADQMFPEKHIRQNCTDLEAWAHSRPHSSGHQMHYDSENEGIGKVRHPIVSCVLYFSEEDVGGPTIMTTQTLQSDKLESSLAYICPPKPNRLCVFDARYLHGVLPGRGFASESASRDTFMIGFWDSIQERPWATTEPKGQPGASRILPMIPSIGQYVRPRGWTREYSWCLNSGDNSLLPEEEFNHLVENLSVNQLVAPIEIGSLWERVDGVETTNHALPNYHTCFQGF